MRHATVVLAFLIQLTGPDGQVISLNVNKITTIRTVRQADHFAKGTQCLVFTADAKHVAVIQTCDIVRQLIEAAK